jgi:N-acetylneuraminic acid mutarotase
MPQSDFGLKAASIGDKIYLVGGSFTFEFDTANSSWLAKTPMPTSRTFFSLTVNQGKIYVIGGRAEDTLTSNEVYDPSTDSWKALKPIPIAAKNVDANAVNGKIYVIGGGDQPAYNMEYNIEKDSWTNKSVMPYPVRAYSSCSLNGRIYVFGGVGSAGNQTQIYYPSTDTWTLGSPLSIAIANSAAVATTGARAPKLIYVLGGSIGIDGNDSNQVYDPVNDSWGSGASLPTARCGLTATLVNDLIYTFGGSSYVVFSPALDVTEKYIPYGYEPTAPTPSIPEFYWLTILPILLTAPIAMAIVRKRLQRNGFDIQFG